MMSLSEIMRMKIGTQSLGTSAYAKSFWNLVKGTVTSLPK